MIETYTTQPAHWNEKAIHPLVSWEWGEAREKMGVQVVRVGETHNGELSDTYQMTLHPLPHTPYFIGYVPRTRIPSPEVLKELVHIARQKGVLFIKFEPYVKQSEVLREHDYFFKESTHSNHPLFPKWTQMLDLTRGEDAIFASLKPKWRYNIKLAHKKGVNVREMTTDAGFEVFSKLYFETAHRQEYAGHSKQYHRTVFETLKDSMSHILVAWYEGVPLGAYHVFLFNDVLYYPYGGSSLEHRNVMGSNALMWETIRFGLRHGAHTFDMWGSLSPDYAGDDSAWGGFTRFKEGYGTDFVEFVGSYDVVLNPILYRVYNVAHIVRSKFFL